MIDIAEGRSPQRGIRSSDDNTLGIDIKTLPLSKACSVFQDTGFIITNPPYGKRLGDQQQAEQVYKDMAGLNSQFPGWKLLVITDHSGFESFFGEKADSCREISNGAIPSYFYSFEL